MDLLNWAGLAAVTAGAALVYTLTGFGFAVLAAPLFLMLVDPAQAIQLVIVISTALSLVALPGLWRVIAPGLLLRLVLGSLAGLPLGLIAFRHADPVLVRAMVGATILGFAVLLGRRRHAGDLSLPFAKRLGLEIATGMVSGIATALIGMAGPPVLIYLLLVGAPPQTVRATLLSFFAFAYAATLASHAATVGIPAQTWLSSGILIPFALLGGLVGRPLGDRLRGGGVCRAREPAARRGRALYARCRNRLGRSSVNLFRLAPTWRRGTVADLGGTVYFSAASSCGTAAAGLEGDDAVDSCVFRCDTTSARVRS